ncbi:hypothetical protein MSAR_04290 [Mycolicibacterium sarraceniae]|uniref:RmlD-like substrate binding domain-containing protein n=1 Tax=Mycolicibacterium sarraceniae TaxID=1534348 RepID=A0A7I7SKQ6_9MYCO|nr:hypothetical protein MSAR_04290 [Mycolicibacterium sarraceniae]
MITGAGGQVGRFLAGEGARRGRVVSTLTHQQCDIVDPVAAERFIAEDDLVVNCAAIANVEPVKGQRHPYEVGDAVDDQARAVFEELGADPNRVRPVSVAHTGRRAPRPAYSALSTVLSVQAGLSPMRPWRAALAEALAQPVGGGQLPSTP